ncbi:MAG TPA: GNAT family N-acetyltransferase [Acidimicrobiales bacterium]|jgi:predicted acetyltransferase
MGLEVRQLRRGEEAAFVASVRVPFLDPVTDDPAERRADERWAAEVEADRAWVAEDHGRFVANGCNYSLDLTLPAAPGQLAPLVPFAGVSAVGVHPTHRRRGVLRQLMAHLLEDARSRGEAFAGLLASESVIYGRFGFGHASTCTQLTIDTQRAAFERPAPELDLRLVDLHEGAKILPELFDRQRRTRAGEPNRNGHFWDVYLEDRPARRHGGSGLFLAVCDDGYVAYRVHEEDVMQASYPRVVIEELRGLTPAVEAGLWRFVLDLDLVGQVTALRRPVDESVRWRLADPRQLQVHHVDDRLYVRILDVPAAFEARGYRREGRLVFDVKPLPDGDGTPDAAPGRWVLEAGPDGAACRAARPGEDADLRLGVTELGALYLGGFPPSLVAAAGRVDELRPRSLIRADELLAVWPAPLTGTGF